MKLIRQVLFRIALWYTLRRVDRLLRRLRAQDRRRFSDAVAATRERARVERLHAMLYQINDTDTDTDNNMK